MAFPNRELSQFGSFLLIDDKGNTIGIATTATPTVGIGTTRSDVKLTVIGDTNISGIVRASEFYRGNDLLTNATVDRWNSGSGDNIYRLSGNIGIGTTIPTQQIDATQTIKAARFISTVTSGTAPFTVSSDTVVPLLNASFIGGKSAPSGSIVGTTDTQTLTNKTIQSSNINVIGAGITFSGSISGTATLKAQSNAVSNTLTLPSTTGTLVSTGDTGSITSNMILDGTITNTDISSSAAIPYTKLTLTGSLVNADIANATIQNAKLANTTISGISLGGNLANLTAGSYINYSSGTTYNGSSAITISVGATSVVGSGNNIVARDTNGDFIARNITISNATASQTVQAADFNTTNTVKVNSVRFVDANRNISAGIVTATRFVGDASLLTSIPSAGWVTTSAGIHTLSNVGIGTTNPTTNLEVRGEILATQFRGVGTNNFFGSGAGKSNVSGCNNNFFGGGAGYCNTTGSYNNFFGTNSGQCNDGSGNSFFGHGAGRSNTIGNNNNFFGNCAGRYNTTGTDNSFFGRSAGLVNTTGGNNNFFGAYAGRSNNTGCNNNFFGGTAGKCNTTGSYNTFLGYYAGRNNQTGSGNIVIGYCRTSTPIINGSNQLVIGSGSNDWIVGNSSYNVGIGTTNPVTKLDVNGSIKGCITRQTAQSPTSGTTVTFSSIPSWAKRITIMFDSVASSFSTNLTVQLGTGAGPTFTTTGYKGSVIGIDPSSSGATSSFKSLFSTEFIVHNDMTSLGSIFGNMYLTNITGNTWTQTSTLNDSTSTTDINSCYGSGSVSLASTLTAVRIVCGLFTAGTINIMYEG